jgi:hypothetical protein
VGLDVPNASKDIRLVTIGESLTSNGEELRRELYAKAGEGEVSVMLSGSGKSEADSEFEGEILRGAVA